MVGVVGVVGAAGAAAVGAAALRTGPGRVIRPLRGGAAGTVTSNRSPGRMKSGSEPMVVRFSA
ncbi:hypothetical protein [Streptacidiphilus albus]|uniref:hypothetical protein n=1 Tax=Streptacidiphilus albus TaxID=105425 RepID=UPI00054C63D3|nr:hypothetical protein [Streptacidiphilus albus]